MRAIIIGAGRGQRLMPTTANGPKCFAEVQGRRILDWAIEALRKGGVTEICFIGGYRIDDVRADYPEFIFRHNDNWPSNNVLASLMYAKDLMDRPFIISYSDILYTGDLVRDLVDAHDDIALGIDTDWKEHYRLRTQHPPDDGEKVIAQNGRIERIHRSIPYEQATGEFVGLAKFSQEGARLLRDHYDRCRSIYSGKPFREAASFEKAYLIHLLQDMIEHGVVIGHADTLGRYREIDLQEDLDLAQTHWKE